MASSIGQFGHPEMGEDEIKGVDGGIVISAGCKHQFIRVHENLVQHPSNNLSIANYYVLTKLYSKFYFLVESTLHFVNLPVN